MGVLKQLLELSCMREMHRLKHFLQSLWNIFDHKTCYCRLIKWILLLILAFGFFVNCRKYFLSRTILIRLMTSLYCQSNVDDLLKYFPLKNLPAGICSLFIPSTHNLSLQIIAFLSCCSHEKTILDKNYFLPSKLRCALQTSQVPHSPQKSFLSVALWLKQNKMKRFVIMI